MEMLGPLLLLTLLGVTLGQTPVLSSCLTVNGETVCYDLYDAGDGNKVAYDNNLCSPPGNPEGSLATVENDEVLDLVRAWAPSMASGELMWIAGEKHPEDIYFRTKTGRILPINDWKRDTERKLSDHLCASVAVDTTWTTQSCDPSSDTLRYYLCQDKTDTCPNEDVCDRTTPYQRNLEEWCFWPYDLRHADNYKIEADMAAYFFCRDLGGYVMSMHNQAELAIVDGIIESHLLQGAANDVYDDGLSFHLSMVGYNYRWRNGYAAVGLKQLGMSVEDHASFFIDRFGGYKQILFMALGSDPLEREYLDFSGEDEKVNLLCEAKRVDLCLHHAYKAPNAVISSNMTHLLYKCENGHQFEDGTNTKLFDCSCDFDALANITRDLTCEATPYCESQLQELGAVCECPPGKTWDESGLECEDIDECKLYNGGCEQICENNDGSFKCGCFEGFKTHPDVTTSCKDVDECHDTDHGCPDHSFCVNTPGSFDCVCQGGFELNDATRMCDDVNECEEDPDICSVNSRCINRYGSYFCECESGYRPTDNDRCEDVDECSWKHSPCSHNCTNQDGDFECSCPSGYQLDANFRTTCIDIDECRIDYGSCLGNQRCENTPGSFQCECNDGFRLDALGVCSDIDECRENLDTCSNNHQCTNVIGSYVCYCGEGQLRRSNGECIYTYSTTDMVFGFRTECSFRPEYEDRNSPGFLSVYRAIEQQYFLLAEQRLVESSFQLDLSPGGGGGTVVEATIGVPFTPDLELTRDVLIAVYRAMRNNNLILYLEGETCPLVRQVSYRTNQYTGVWDFSNICAIDDSLDYCNNGRCEAVQGQDQPRCRCPRGFSGERCDEEAEVAPTLWNPLTIALLGFAGFITLLLLLCCCRWFLSRGGRVNRPPLVGPPAKPMPRYSPWNAFRPPLGTTPGPFQLRA